MDNTRAGSPLRRQPAIIFINRYFYPDLSATSQMLSDLAFDLARDHCVVVITSRLRYDSRARLPNAETIRGVRVRRIATTGFGRASLLGRSADLVSFHLAASLALLRETRRGDVIVAKTDPPLISVVAGWMASLKRARLVNWLQDLYPEAAVALGVRGLNGGLARALKAVRDASLTRARVNVTVGEQMAARLRELSVPDKRVRVIPNWADETAISPIAAEDKSLCSAWGLEGRFVVAYSGNLGRAHEYETMLGAAALLADIPTIAFLMIGGGHHTDNLREEAQAAGLANIVFRPYQPFELLAQSLGAGDVHWISLRPELEGLIVPSKAYGVLAAGRPIIAVTHAQGEIARLVAAHGCGFQIDPGDAQGFAAVVRRLASEPALVARLGIAARAAATGPLSQRIQLARWRDTLAAVSGG
ncbi:MAG TPA: glycosyltransferase family 4 protein [Caulobacteraceae bacterium]|jgi:glycosyltransferase involved in cell wall biosynthesis